MAEAMKKAKSPFMQPGFDPGVRPPPPWATPPPAAGVPPPPPLVKPWPLQLPPPKFSSKLLGEVVNAFAKGMSVEEMNRELATKGIVPPPKVGPGTPGQLTYAQLSRGLEKKGLVAMSAGRMVSPVRAAPVSSPAEAVALMKKAANELKLAENAKRAADSRLRNAESQLAQTLTQLAKAQARRPYEVSIVAIHERQAEKRRTDLQAAKLTAIAATARYTGARVAHDQLAAEQRAERQRQKAARGRFPSAVPPTPSVLPASVLPATGIWALKAKVEAARAKKETAAAWKRAREDVSADTFYTYDELIWDFDLTSPASKPASDPVAVPLAIAAAKQAMAELATTGSVLGANALLAKQGVAPPAPGMPAKTAGQVAYKAVARGLEAKGIVKTVAGKIVHVVLKPPMPKSMKVDVEAQKAAAAARLWERQRELIEARLPKVGITRFLPLWLRRGMTRAG